MAGGVFAGGEGHSLVAFDGLVVGVAVLVRTEEEVGVVAVAPPDAGALPVEAAGG